MQQRYSFSELEQKLLEARKQIVTMVELAGCGHPGGSLSSIHGLMAVLNRMSFDDKDPDWEDRDKLVVSHGHISPGTYAALTAFGLADVNEVYEGFRNVGSHFGGHVESTVPGIEWNTGNLGQGLSAAVGFALASRIKGKASHAFCLMGDGEQQKGQIAEARRFARKYDLGNVHALVDYNRLQIGGAIGKIMPQDIIAGFKADGWKVIEVDGHSFKDIDEAITSSVKDAHEPCCIILDTVMGKGYPEIENMEKYHGQALGPDLYKTVSESFDSQVNFDEIKLKRQTFAENAKLADVSRFPSRAAVPVGDIDSQGRIVYPAGEKADCRSGYGNAIHDLAKKNPEKIVAFSCDLEGSVKLNKFHKDFPEMFYEVGIQEHHAAAMAGALGREGLVSFFSTFGVFGVCEAYNQQRLNDQNQANIKVACTHIGLDVGEDGPTHQNIDYIGLLRNLFGFKIFLPMDANQTDAIVRYSASIDGPVFIGMGRSKYLPATKEDGSVFYDENYSFSPGKLEEIRKGNSGVVVVATGSAANYAFKGVETLKRDHDISVSFYNAPSIKPFDEKGLVDAVTGAKTLITMEDHNVHTGLGELCASTLFKNAKVLDHIRMGVKTYGSSAKSELLFKEQGLDDKALVSRVLELV